MLANCLNTMLDRLSDIDPMRRRSRILENFTIELMVDGTEKALLELLNGE